MRLFLPMTAAPSSAPPVSLPREVAAQFDTAPAGNYKWKVLAVVGSGVYMVTLDSGIVNVALPAITREFATSLLVAQWVILGYVLCITGLLLPAGRLADMLGRREVFLAGFLVFAAASAMCGLSPGVGWLIAARVLQGVGGALIQANTAALLTQAFPAKERGRALGLNSSIVSVGLLSGPVIGGLITQQLGWRWAFYVNLPISLVAAPLGWRLLRPSPVIKDQRFDPVGAALFLLAAVTLLLGLNQGETWGWTSPAIVGLLAAAVACTATFLWVEGRVAQPTIDLMLFRNRGFSAAALAAVLSFLAISSVTLLMPFYYQRVLGLRADQTGLLLIAIPATVALLAPLSGSLSDRFGSRIIASAGMAIEAIGLALLVTLPEQGTPLWAAARLVLVGVGLAFFQSPNSSALFSSVPRSRLGMVGGFQALTRNLGQSLGQVVAGAAWTIVVLAVSADSVTTAVEAPSSAMMSGFRLVFVWSAFLALAAMVTSFVRPTEAHPEA